MARSTPDGHHRGLNRIRPFPAGGGPVLSATLILADHRSRAAGYEPVAEEPPEVTAISCMRCVKPSSRAGISVAPAVGNPAIA